jgi:hypothetical protein
MTDSEAAGTEEIARLSEGFTRPPARVLPESAIVPSKNLIVPAPNQFTHTVTRTQPFFYGAAQDAEAPDGELPAGTEVVLLVYDAGQYCRVADGRGLYVEIEYGALAELEALETS